MWYAVCPWRCRGHLTNNILYLWHDFIDMGRITDKIRWSRSKRNAEIRPGVFCSASAVKGDRADEDKETKECVLATIGGWLPCLFILPSFLCVTAQPRTCFMRATCCERGGRIWQVLDRELDSVPCLALQAGALRGCTTTVHNALSLHRDHCPRHFHSAPGLYIYHRCTHSIYHPFHTPP